MMTHRGAVACFQDAWTAFEQERRGGTVNTADCFTEHGDGGERHRHEEGHHHQQQQQPPPPSSSHDDVSDVFFELANAPVVGYRLPQQQQQQRAGDPRRGRNDGTRRKNGANGNRPPAAGLPPASSEAASSSARAAHDDDGAAAAAAADSSCTDDDDDDASSSSPPVIIVTIEQDVSGAAQKHTGGIVWETAYLLLNYLLYNPGGDDDDDDDGNDDNGNDAGFLARTKTQTVLELGAGCGMVGLAIYGAHRAMMMTTTGCGGGSGVIGGRGEVSGVGEDAKDAPESCIRAVAAADGSNRAGDSSFRVILTETDQVMGNLRRNLNRNYPNHHQQDDVPTIQRQEQQPPTSCTSSSSSSSSFPRLSICELDWTRCEEDCRRGGIDPHSVDVLLGTDVVFSTSLVEPLLRTMEYLSHPKTVAYLCLQERCKDSHSMLLGTAGRYGFDVHDLSDHTFGSIPACRFGRDLECKLLKFTRTPEAEEAPSSPAKGEEKKNHHAAIKRKREQKKGGWDA